MLDLSQVTSGVVGGGCVLALQALSRALVSEAAKRIALTSWGIRKFDGFTPNLFRHPLWSGRGEVAWVADSNNFADKNSTSTQVYRCFGWVSFECEGKTITGKIICYRFLGKLSRDGTVLEGSWFDKNGQGIGYHGVFQLRAKGNGHMAEGIWIGFSETSGSVKAGSLVWDRQGD